MDIAGLLFNPWVHKLIWAIGITTALTSGYYIWHTKPIQDLKEEIFEQERILEKNKEKVTDSKKDAVLFEDKWIYVKDGIIISEDTKESNDNNKPNTQVDVTHGEHTIDL